MSSYQRFCGIPLGLFLGRKRGREGERREREREEESGRDLDGERVGGGEGRREGQREGDIYSERERELKKNREKEINGESNNALTVMKIGAMTYQQGTKYQCSILRVTEPVICPVWDTSLNAPETYDHTSLNHTAFKLGNRSIISTHKLNFLLLWPFPYLGSSSLQTPCSPVLCFFSLYSFLLHVFSYNITPPQFWSSHLQPPPFTNGHHVQFNVARHIFLGLHHHLVTAC